jgi:hypothetical protein
LSDPRHVSALRGIRCVLLLVALPAVLTAQAAAGPSVVERIQQEAFTRSQVMEHAFTLADVYGPRLTGSPAFEAAGAWATTRLRELGLEQVRRQPIEWGRSWSYSTFGVYMLEPYGATLVAAPGPWSGSTNGRVTGEPVLAPAPTDVTEESYRRFVEAHRGRLRGRMVLLSPPRGIQPAPTSPSPTRFSDDELARLARATPPHPSPAFPDSLFDQFRVWGRRLNRFFLDEAVAALIHQSRGDGGMVVSFGPDWARGNDTTLPPTVFLAAEQYSHIVRLVQRKIPVRLAVELEARTHDDAAAAFNVIAELTGSTHKGEVILLGAHLDSWTGGTGATDNAAGCAIAIEALRILAALDVRPKRTIRLALWGGHEGAGVGSETYVRTRSSGERILTYFNLDNGGGKVRGVYLAQRDERLRPTFERWLAPVASLGARTVIPIAVPSGSDHATFFRAGLPGVMFVQDQLDYRTRTRHSNMDRYDYLHSADLQQAAAVVAAFIYQAATDDWPSPAESRRP